VSPESKEDVLPLNSGENKKSSVSKENTISNPTIISEENESRNNNGQLPL